MSKPDALTLTRRQITNERTRVFQQLAGLNDRLIKIALGDVEANPTQVAAAKAVIDRLMPQLKEEDLDTATAEPKSREELVTILADSMKDESLIKAVAGNHKEAAIKCRDILNRILPESAVAEIAGKIGA